MPESSKMEPSTHNALAAAKGPPFRPRVFFTCIGLLIASIVIFEMLVSSRPQPQAQPKTEDIFRVATRMIQPGTYQPTIDLLGRVQSPKEVTLSSSVTAFVVKVWVRDGQTVKQDDLLVQLDAVDAELLLSQRDADVIDVMARIDSELARFTTDKTALTVELAILDTNEQALKRFDNLIKKDLGAQSSRDDALRQAKQAALNVASRQLSIKDHNNRLKQLKAALQRAKALRDQAALDVDRTLIKAPFNGRITDVNAGLGERIRTGDTILTLYSTDDLEVRAQVPSRYLSTVRDSLNRTSAAINNGLSAKALVDDQTINLQLRRLAGDIALGRGGVDGLFQVLEPGNRLELGRSVTVQLALPAIADVLPVPLSAIYGQERIYLIEESRLKRVDIIEVGQWQDSSGKRFQLVQPVGTSIDKPSQVLTTQLPNAISGLKVDIIEG